MSRTRTVLTALTARPSRRPHETLAWLAAVCLVLAAAAYSPWMPWPPHLRTVVLAASLAAAVCMAAGAGVLWWSARRAAQVADLDRQMAELDAAGGDPDDDDWRDEARRYA